MLPKPGFVDRPLRHGYKRLMRPRLIWAFVCVMCAAPVWAGGITVSAAISLKEALTQIASGFEAAGGDTMQLNFGASGQLAAQIAQGAPVDLFISAGRREMDQLAKQGLIDPAALENICGNELVLIVPADAAFTPGSFSELTDTRVRRIAVGQPKIVPAGQYAQEVFDHLKIAGELAPKLVFGQNVRQVLDYVERGEVDAGVVYSTDAVAAGDKVRVAAKADASLHEPIIYPAAVIKQSSQAETARQFLNYLNTDAARRVLASHGFVVAAPTTAPAP
jgi:molybdate transport system substrate-binding protein